MCYTNLHNALRLIKCTWSQIVQEGSGCFSQRLAAFLAGLNCSAPEMCLQERFYRQTHPGVFPSEHSPTASQRHMVRGFTETRAVGLG